MKFEHIPANRIPYEWHWMSTLLKPAIEVSKSNTVLEVFRDLVSRRSDAYYIGNREGAVLAIMAPCENDIFWIEYLAGQVDGGPRKFIDTIQSGMKEIEKAAKAGGASEIRLSGRDWSRILTDYVLTGGKNHELRKVL